MLNKKQKLRYIIYGILYMILWLFSILQVDRIFLQLLSKPDILIFMLLTTKLFCLWEGISGMTRNIMRLQLDKTISELEKMINVSKRKD